MSSSEQARRELVLPELARKQANNVRIGTIMAVDYSKARVRVKTGDLESNWIPWLTGSTKGKRIWNPPKEGEQVVMLSPGGDMTQAVVLPGIFAQNQSANGDNGDVDRTTYDDGTVIEYDQASKTLKATLTGGGKADITAPGGMKITGNVEIVGSLTATQGISAGGSINADGDISSKAEVVAKSGTPTIVHLSTHNHPTAPTGPISPPTPGS